MTRLIPDPARPACELAAQFRIQHHANARKHKDGRDYYLLKRRS